MYSAVNTTLYRWFAIVGGFYQVGSIVATAILTYLVRQRGTSAAWTAGGATLLLLAFCVWLAVVAPVNAEVGDALRQTPDAVPSVWMMHRTRWELGHVAGFVVQVLGLAALLMSVLVERRGRGPRLIASAARPKTATRRTCAGRTGATRLSRCARRSAIASSTVG